MTPTSHAYALRRYKNRRRHVARRHGQGRRVARAAPSLEEERFCRPRLRQAPRFDDDKKAKADAKKKKRSRPRCAAADGASRLGRVGPLGRRYRRPRSRNGAAGARGRGRGAGPLAVAEARKNRYDTALLIIASSPLPAALDHQGRGRRRRSRSSKPKARATAPLVGRLRQPPAWRAGAAQPGRTTRAAQTPGSSCRRGLSLRPRSGRGQDAVAEPAAIQTDAVPRGAGEACRARSVAVSWICCDPRRTILYYSYVITIL